MSGEYTVLSSADLDAGYKDFIVEGEKAGQLSEIAGRPGVRAGVFRVESGEEADGTPIPYVFETDEYIWVIEGDVQIECSDGETVVLRPGDSAYFRQGSESTWTFHAPFRKFSVEIEGHDA